MSTSKAAHKPSDLEAQYRGETRNADGYQYWTTSEEDEESLDIREQVAAGDYDEKKVVVKKERRRLAPRGFWRRSAIRLASMTLAILVAAIGYLVFNYVQVSGAADTDETQRVDAIVVLGADHANGRPSAVLQERLDHAYNLFEQNYAPTIVTTGAAAPGDTVSAAAAGQSHLVGKGVAPENIKTIEVGSNSWEHLHAVLEDMSDQSYDSVLIVSDSYHTQRLLSITEELGIEAYVSPSAVEPALSDYMRETLAVSIGRVAGYEGLTGLTS